MCCFQDKVSSMVNPINLISVALIIGFVDARTGAHSNTIESTWRHVMAFLNPYNRKGDYIHHLALYMFSAICRAEKVDQFTKFLHLVATIDLSECPTASQTLLGWQPPSPQTIYESTAFY